MFRLKKYSTKILPVPGKEPPMPAVSAATASPSRGHISTAAPISLTSHSKAQQHSTRTLAWLHREITAPLLSLSSHDV